MCFGGVCSPKGPFINDVTHIGGRGKGRGGMALS